METIRDWPDHYEALRERVRWFWLIGAGQIIATIVLVLLAAQLSAQLATIIFIVSVLIYCIAFPFVTIRMFAFRCPKCDQKAVPFWKVPPPFLIKCGSCALPLK
ncbi:hypothetical protein [Sphingopyxis sp.]|uniref:hypothetical protein n=1 Tax=Sphingopyxis sp. TaxID=1908224 RepID=UPI003D1217C5